MTLIGHAVAVQDDVEAALEVRARDGDLVDREPVVLVGVGADQPDGGRPLLPLAIDVADPTEPVHENAVHPVVLGDRIDRGR